MLLDFLLAGLVIGGIYALIAIGLNLQYGVARVLNLAYGEFLMLAGYAAFWAFTLVGAPPLLTMLAGAPLAFGLSWLLFRFVLHPLLGRTSDQGKREVDSILSTFGLLFVLQGVALVAWTGTDRTYSYLSVPVHMFGTVMVANRLIVLIAALVLSAAVFAFLRYSNAGRAMRAIAASPHTAPLVGIDVRHYSALAFATGGALAATAGILLSSFIGINPTIGAAFTVKALIVIVMGGIGHVMGGLIAALILGLAETMAALLLDPGLVTVINFAIFSIVLLWRPQGLFSGGSRTGTPLRIPKYAPAILALVALLFVPYFANTYWLSLAVNILTYIALATGWAFFSGPTRYVSLAASAFFGIGAYAIAVLAPDYSYPVALLAAAVIALVLSAFVGLATLRLSGMYFVIFTFGLASLVSAAVTWWEFNIARKAGWHLFLSITTTHIYYQLLALCAAIVALVDHPRSQPHGLCVDDAGRRRDRRPPDRNQYRRAEDRHLRRELRRDGARGRHPLPALLLYGCHRCLQSHHLVPDRHHGAAGRRHVGVGSDARRHSAGADLGLPVGHAAKSFQRRAWPGPARHRLLHPGWHCRPSRAPAAPPCTRTNLPTCWNGWRGVCAHPVRHRPRLRPAP